MGPCKPTQPWQQSAPLQAYHAVTTLAGQVWSDMQQSSRSFLLFVCCFCFFSFSGKDSLTTSRWYGVTLLSGSIAASSGMARRAVAPTLQPNQLWNNCRLQVLVGGGASWTLPWRALKNRRQPPQSIRPEATQDRRQADTSEPPARTTPHQRTNTPHSDGVFGLCSFQPLWLVVCGPPPNRGGSTLFLAC